MLSQVRLIPSISNTNNYSRHNTKKKDEYLHFLVASVFKGIKTYLVVPKYIFF